MEYENDKLDAEFSNPYKLAMLQNVHVKPVPLGKEIFGIYIQPVDGEFQIFLNEKLQIEDHELFDKTLYILMNHHNSDRKGETKYLTADDLKLFKRIKDEVKRYEQKVVDAFLKSVSFSSKIFNY